MKNKLTDLNDHLFAALERINDESLTGNKLTEEIERSKAITSVAAVVVNNAKLALDVAVAVHECRVNKLPTMISGPRGSAE